MSDSNCTETEETVSVASTDLESGTAGTGTGGAQTTEEEEVEMSEAWKGQQVGGLVNPMMQMMATVAGPVVPQEMSPADWMKKFETRHGLKQRDKCPEEKDVFSLRSLPPEVLDPEIRRMRVQRLDPAVLESMKRNLAIRETLRKHFETVALTKDKN